MRKNYVIEKIDESLFQINDEKEKEKDDGIKNKILIISIGKYEGYIIDWSGFGIEDDMRETGERFTQDIGFDIPEEMGLWIFEGDYNYLEDIGEIAFDGKFRRPTIIEMEKIAYGESLWKKKNKKVEYYKTFFGAWK